MTAHPDETRQPQWNDASADDSELAEATGGSAFVDWGDGDLPAADDEPGVGCDGFNAKWLK